MHVKFVHGVLLDGVYQRSAEDAREFVEVATPTDGHQGHGGHEVTPDPQFLRTTFKQREVCLCLPLDREGRSIRVAGMARLSGVRLTRQARTGIAPTERILVLLCPDI